MKTFKNTLFHVYIGYTPKQYNVAKFAALGSTAQAQKFQKLEGWLIKSNSRGEGGGYNFMLSIKTPLKVLCGVVNTCRPNIKLITFCAIWRYQDVMG